MVALLAAGQAKRFGGGKLDAPCAGRPLGAWAARAVEDAKFTSRILIVPEKCPDFAQDLAGWHIITNPTADNDLTASVRLAARAATGHARLVILLADMPLVEASHLRALAASDTIAFTAYPDGKRGVPAGFPARHFATLATLSLSAARFDWDGEVSLLHPRRSDSLIDVDTQDDLAQAERLITILARS